jgi:hypothetical protein
MLPFIFLTGISAAMVVDHLDPHIYTKEDVESVLGFSPIGSLFADKEVTQLVFDEGVLRLAAAVDHATRVTGTRTFVLTAVDLNGKTVPIMENLAHALAGLSRKVITIDVSGNDKPVAYASVEMNNLAGSRAQQSMMWPNPQNFPVSARIAPLPSFVSDAFQKLTINYEIVLINAAPLLCSAETEYLARCADVTILVATASQTKKDLLFRAARVLERMDVSGVAAIISEVSLLRVDNSVKNDVRDFEARSNVANLHWKSKFSPFVVGGACCNEDAERAAPSSEEPVADLG